jgi:hypothetical protein
LGFGVKPIVRKEGPMKPTTLVLSVFLIMSLWHALAHSLEARVVKKN